MRGALRSTTAADRVTLFTHTLNTHNRSRNWDREGCFRWRVRWHEICPWQMCRTTSPKHRCNQSERGRLPLCRRTRLLQPWKTRLTVVRRTEYVPSEQFACVSEHAIANTSPRTQRWWTCDRKRDWGVRTDRRFFGGVQGRCVERCTCCLCKKRTPECCA